MASDFIYLLSSLPTLTLTGEGAPAWSDFLQVCRSRLSAAEAGVIERLTLTPAKDAADTDVAVIRKWYEWVTGMRNAVAAHRARLLKRDLAHANAAEDNAEPGDLKRVEAVMELRSARLRQEGWEALLWSRLDELAGSEYYSFAAVIFYALKLRILESRKQYDAAAGSQRFEQLVAARESEALEHRRNEE